MECIWMTQLKYCECKKCVLRREAHLAMLREYRPFRKKVTK